MCASVCRLRVASSDAAVAAADATDVYIYIVDVPTHTHAKIHYALAAFYVCLSVIHVITRI